MWLLKCLIFTFLAHIIFTDAGDLQGMSEVQSQAIIEVLNNISIANEILQDLINNYHRIQEIYKSVEKSESQSSGSEIDTLYKIRASNQQNKPLSKSEHSNYFVNAGTAMFYGASAEDQTETAFSKSAKEVNVPTDKNIENSESSDEEQSTEDTSDEMVLAIPILPLPGESLKRVTTKEPPLNLSKNTIKTRFNVKNRAKKTRTRVRNEKSRDKNDSRRVRKVIYVETFNSNKIWQEMKNRPINLRTSISKEQTGENLPLQLFKNLNKSVHNHSFSDTVGGISKKKVLRDTYGEVCILVAVKKCFKALKSVLKDVCKRGSKCKSKFKSTFRQKSKTACVGEFSYKQNDITTVATTKKEMVPLIFKKKRKKIPTKRFPDATRNRYLDTCIPAMVDNQKSIKRENASTVQLNILRDEYEKKCKKLSSKKCNSACEFTYSGSCETHSCKKTQKKWFKKSCKKKCNEAYNVKTKDSSTESSESSSDSDSDSTDKSKSK